MHSLIPNLPIAFAIELVTLAIFWRLIWPAWKRPAKPVFYLTIATLLTLWLGPWALVFIIGHPLIGIVFHWRFCTTHGFSPWRVEDPERYVALQRRAVASLGERGQSPPSSTDQ